MKKGCKAAFSSIKREFNDHLEAINQNTSEIQSIYDFLSELDGKIEKMNERLDELQMYVNPDMSHEQFDVELTLREQEVFVVLYAENEAVKAQDVARRLGFTDEMVNRYIYNLISKGIPILKKYDDDEMYVSLDERFKQLQARKSVLDIDESISRQLMADKAL